MWINKRFQIFLMFELIDTQTRKNEQTFAFFFFMFHTEGPFVVSNDAKDSIFLSFFNY